MPINPITPRHDQPEEQRAEGKRGLERKPYQTNRTPMLGAVM